MSLSSVSNPTILFNCRAQKYFHFDHLLPIKAKGYSSTVPVFRPMPLIAESSGTVEDDSSTFMSTEKLNMGNNDFSYTESVALHTL